MLSAILIDIVQIVKAVFDPVVEASFKIVKIS